MLVVLSFFYFFWWMLVAKLSTPQLFPFFCFLYFISHALYHVFHILWFFLLSLISLSHISYITISKEISTIQFAALSRSPGSVFPDECGASLFLLLTFFSPNHSPPLPDNNSKKMKVNKNNNNNSNKKERITETRGHIIFGIWDLEWWIVRIAS